MWSHCLPRERISMPAEVLRANVQAYACIMRAIVSVAFTVLSFWSSAAWNDETHYPESDNRVMFRPHVAA